MIHGYKQIILEEDSKWYVTVNTYKGLFQYNQLPFGVSSAAAVFHRTTEGLIQGIPHVVVYLDDILITATTNTVHLQHLVKVVNGLQEAGLCLKRVSIPSWHMKCYQVGMPRDYTQ